MSSKPGKSGGSLCWHWVTEALRQKEVELAAFKLKLKHKEEEGAIADRDLAAVWGGAEARVRLERCLILFVCVWTRPG